MDEEVSIIDQNTRNEKLKNFFFKNKKRLITTLIFIILILLFYFGYSELVDRKKINISDKYNKLIIEFNHKDKNSTTRGLIEIINQKDPTYSPLALYFIIDNKLLNDLKKINDYFDVLINDTSLNEEIKYLIIYKKALYNSDLSNEIELLEILKPILNSNSVWKSQSLYLIAEFFYSKNQKQKSKEFFEQIIKLENPNQEIKIKAQKRLNRDLSE